MTTNNNNLKLENDNLKKDPVSKDDELKAKQQDLDTANSDILSMKKELASKGDELKALRADLEAKLEEEDLEAEKKKHDDEKQTSEANQEEAMHILKSKNELLKGEVTSMHRQLEETKDNNQQLKDDNSNNSINGNDDIEEKGDRAGMIATSLIADDESNEKLNNDFGIKNNSVPENDNEEDDDGFNFGDYGGNENEDDDGLEAVEVENAVTSTDIARVSSDTEDTNANTDANTDANTNANKPVVIIEMGPRDHIWSYSI